MVGYGFRPQGGNETNMGNGRGAERRGRATEGEEGKGGMEGGGVRGSGRGRRERGREGSERHVLFLLYLLGNAGYTS